MRRRDFIALMASAAASLPQRALAQKKLLRVGWLVFGGASLGRIDQTLKDALSQGGFVDDGNLQIIFRYANGQPMRLPDLAEELVAQKPDLLLAVGGDILKALFDASKGAIPVVGGASDSPIRSGLAVSLANPGKNFTGVTFLTDEMAAKRMELLSEVAPEAKRVAVIFNPQHLDDELTFARKGAQSIGIDLTSHPISNPDELESALQSAKSNGANGLFVVASRLTNLLAPRIAQYGLEHRLPVIAAWREFAVSGALLSYGPDRIFEAKRLAGYVQKVLTGTKPAALPIEQPIKFELVINLKTARSIGLPISRDLMLRADDIIE